MSSSSKSKRPRSTSRSLKDEVSRGGRKSSRSTKRHRRSSNKKRKNEDHSEDESGSHDYGNILPASGFTDYDPAARRDSSSRRSASVGRSSSPKNWWEHRPPYVKKLSRRSPGRGDSRRMDEFARSSMPRGRGSRGHHIPRNIPMMYHQESGGGPMMAQMMHPGMMPFPVGGHEGGPGHWRPSDSSGFYMAPNMDPHMGHFGSGRGAPGGFSMAPGQMHRHYGHPGQGDSRYSSGGSRSSSYDSKSSRSSKGGSSRPDRKRRKRRNSRGHRSRRKIEKSFNSGPGGPPAGFRGPRASGQPAFARKDEASSWTERGGGGAHQNKSLQSNIKQVDVPALPGRLRFIPPEPFDESEEHDLLQAVEAEVNGDEERGCVPIVFHLVPPHLAGPSLYAKLKEFV